MEILRLSDTRYSGLSDTRYSANGPKGNGDMQAKGKWRYASSIARLKCATYPARLKCATYPSRLNAATYPRSQYMFMWAADRATYPWSQNMVQAVKRDWNVPATRDLNIWLWLTVETLFPTVSRKTRLKIANLNMWLCGRYRNAPPIRDLIHGYVGGRFVLDFPSALRFMRYGR